VSTVNTQEPKASLLVVDDEKHQRESLALILEDEGYKVTAAADGREALAKAAEIRPKSFSPTSRCRASPAWTW